MANVNLNQPDPNGPNQEDLLLGYDQIPPPPPDLNELHGEHNQPMQVDELEQFLNNLPPNQPFQQPITAQCPGLPALQREVTPEAPEQLDQYYASLIPMSTLMEQFTKYNKTFKFSPAVPDPGLKPLTDISAQVETFISSAETRIGLTIAPLLEMFQTSGGDQRIADSLLGVIQGLTQLDYTRRLLLLENQWRNLTAVKRVLQHSADTFKRGMLVCFYKINIIL